MTYYTNVIIYIMLIFFFLSIFYSILLDEHMSAKQEKQTIHTYIYIYIYMATRQQLQQLSHHHYPKVWGSVAAALTIPKFDVHTPMFCILIFQNVCSNAYKHYFSRKLRQFLEPTRFG